MPWNDSDPNLGIMNTPIAHLYCISIIAVCVWYLVSACAQIWIRVPKFSRGILDNGIIIIKFILLDVLPQTTHMSFLAYDLRCYAKNPAFKRRLNISLIDLKDDGTERKKNIEKVFTLKSGRCPSHSINSFTPIAHNVNKNIIIIIINSFLWYYLFLTVV